MRWPWSKNKEEPYDDYWARIGKACRDEECCVRHLLYKVSLEHPDGGDPSIVKRRDVVEGLSSQQHYQVALWSACHEKQNPEECNECAQEISHRRMK